MIIDFARYESYGEIGSRQLLATYGNGLLLLVYTTTSIPGPLVGAGEITSKLRAGNIVNSYAIFCQPKRGFH